MLNLNLNTFCFQVSETQDDLDHQERSSSTGVTSLFTSQADPEATSPAYPDPGAEAGADTGASPAYLSLKVIRGNYG